MEKAFLKRTWAEIDLDALCHNARLIRKRANSELMAVVKADAYGHGAVPVAKALQGVGVHAFAVSNLDEALELRRGDMVDPVLILGYTPPETAVCLAKHGISQAVFSSEYAKALSKEAVSAGVTVKVHIKLDTGMGRIGFDCRTNDLVGLKEAVSAAGLPGLQAEGVFTHFCVADSVDGTVFTEEQNRRFFTAVKALKQAGCALTYIHCQNSAGVINEGLTGGNYCRPGIILYGLQPSNEVTLSGLQPVMTLKSTVSFVKTVRPGETVGYGRTFTADKPIQVATVAVGYGDGYPRSMSNGGVVLINGRKATVIGNVCMDQLMVDVTDVPGVTMGSEAILFGRDLPVEQLAAARRTISYEILCGITERVPRVYRSKNSAD